MEVKEVYSTYSTYIQIIYTNHKHIQICTPLKSNIPCGDGNSGGGGGGGGGGGCGGGRGGGGEDIKNGWKDVK